MKTDADILAYHLPNRSGVRSGNALIVHTEAQNIRETVRSLMRNGAQYIMMFATDERIARNAFRIHYVFGIPGESVFIVPIVSLVGTTSFPSLCAEFPALTLYEREIMTMFGLKAEGHPDPRSLILHEENWPAGLYPLRKDFKWDTKVPMTPSGEYKFNKVGGEGIYEIPVGPIHAGIIEPGNFRFSVAGEEIIALEARLGWVHKGVEKLFENLPIEKQVVLSEHVSGDSAFSHSLAFCEALETITEAKVPARAQYLRLIFAELERLTMHIFDIGNIAGNGTGFSFMSAQGFRMSEDLRRMSQRLAGNRFFRGINTPGGITKDISSQDAIALSQFLTGLKKDFTDIIRVVESSATFANRVSTAGIIPPEVAHDYAAVGIVARCNNIPKDVRLEYPYGAYKRIVPEIALTQTGDVEARFYLRIKEVYESMKLIHKALETLPSGPILATLPPLPKDGIGIGAVEAWRGELAYIVVVQDGAITRVKVRDASFIHWQLVSHMTSVDMVPDFPLINKSLNLSYTGNDL